MPVLLFFFSISRLFVFFLLDFDVLKNDFVFWPEIARIYRRIGRRIAQYWFDAYRILACSFLRIDTILIKNYKKGAF